VVGSRQHNPAGGLQTRGTKSGETAFDHRVCRAWLCGHGGLGGTAPLAAVQYVAVKFHFGSIESRESQKAPTADRVSEIQSALARGGYYQGDANGKWDSNTVAAVQKFQSANGIEANGKLDAPTLQKLGLGSDIAGVSAPKPTTAPGSTAPASPPSSQTAPPGGQIASASTSSGVSSSPAKTSTH
jgi:hypothetical protein